MELVSEVVFTFNGQVVKQLAMISEKTTIKKQGKISSVHEMLIAEVRIYLANCRVGDWATVGTLAALWNRMHGDNRMPDENRMLDDGPKGGYR